MQPALKNSFEELVIQYQDIVYNTILGIVQQEEDAEELTQDVFLKVYESVDTFRGDAKLSTWLYRIAVNKSIDFLRKQKGRHKAFLSMFNGHREAASEKEFHHPGVSIDRKEDAAVLFKAIEKLPAQQKAAFILQKLEGQSVEEIAAILDTTPKATESLLSRAGNNLKIWLEDYYKINY